MANITIQNKLNKIVIAASGTATASNTVTLNTAGTYVDSNIDIVNSVEVDVKAGVLNNTATEGVAYTENTDASTVIPAGGKLYINEGYYPNTSISLGQLIPDDSNYENAGSGKILSGYEAYDSDGNKLVGTIPTITPTFTGGGVTATAGGSVTTAPKVTVNSSGSFKSASSYGVTTTKPSGTDGTNYLTIDGSGAATGGTVKATADASRTAVTYAAATTGYVNKASGTQASAAANATQNTKDIAVTPTVVDSFDPLYIPVVSASFAGGAVTATAGGSVTTAPKVTSNITGTVTDIATTTKPSGTDGTNYYTITPSGTPTNGTVKATADASRTAVTYTNAAGAIAAHSGATASASASATQNTKNVTVAPTAAAGSEYYIPASSKSASVSSHTVTKAKATADTSVAATNSVSTAGILTTQPTTGDYITIAPTISSTAGSSSAKAKATTTAGYIVAGDVESSADTKSVGVTTSTGTKRYIKVFDGSYSVA